jgi:uncharacterized protein YggT (Ycf19 family)
VCSVNKRHLIFPSQRVVPMALCISFVIVFALFIYLFIFLKLRKSQNWTRKPYRPFISNQTTPLTKPRNAHKRKEPRILLDRTLDVIKIFAALFILFIFLKLGKSQNWNRKPYLPFISNQTTPLTKPRNAHKRKEPRILLDRTLDVIKIFAS